MTTSESLLCLAAGVAMLLAASFLWSHLDRATGASHLPWYRRLFWRRTLRDLLAELAAGKRTAIGREEIELAQAYERRRLPAGLRFPRGGEVYEALADVEVRYVTAHAAPFTGGGDAVLPRGTRVRVCGTSDPEPMSVWCEPLDASLYERIVPAEERAAPSYDGASLSIDTVDLSRSFRRVGSEEADGTAARPVG